MSKKRKIVERVPLLELACFMHKYKNLQAGLLQDNFSFLQNLQNFLIMKYLKQEVDVDLIVCMDECSPCGLYNWRYKYLTVSHNQKVMMLLTAMEKCPMDLFLLNKFYDSGLFVTRDKDIC